MRRFTGLIAASFTPFHADGEVDYERIPRVVDYLIQQEVSGIYALGSTGEGASLTFAERRMAAREFVKAAEGRLPVIVQVGHESLVQARELAAHAQEIGAAAVSAVGPLYFKPPNVESLVDSMARIAAGAPRLPFYYYHIPGITGLAFSMVEFLRLGAERIPTLQGIKFTAPQIHEYQACVDLAAGRFDILYGMDEMLLSGLVAGAAGAVGSTYNFAAPIYQRLLAAFAAGNLNEARRCQAQAQALVRVLMRYEPRAAQKAVMAMCGIDCGPCRLPLATMSSAQYEALRGDLTALGFLNGLAPPVKDV